MTRKYAAAIGIASAALAAVSHPAYASQSHEPSEVAAVLSCHGHRATIVGTDGNDTLVGTRGRDVIVGRGGVDDVKGRGGRDLICGTAGVDVLSGGAGNDYLSGGPGMDWLRYEGAAHGVTVRLARGSATGQGHDRLASIENVEGSLHADDLYGTAVSNHLWGRGGNDTFHGGGGGDTLSGGAGDDFLADTRGGYNWVTGGPGNDQLQAAPINTEYYLNGGSGVDTVQFFYAAGITVDLASGEVTYPATDTALQFEVVVGTHGSDTVYGSAADDTLYGGAGDDYLDGRGGDNTVDGGDGIDDCFNANQASNCES